MKNFWWKQPKYKRFEDKIHFRFLFNKSRMNYIGLIPEYIPGYIGDPNLAFGLFERWVNRSRKAKKIYWLSHKECIR
jgi:hypothetical protein